LPVTYHVVVAFDRDEEGDLKPGEAQEVMSPIVAERRARALALEHAGALAFSRTGNPATGGSPPSEQAKVSTAKSNRNVSLDDIEEAKTSLITSPGGDYLARMRRRRKRRAEWFSARKRRVPGRKYSRSGRWKAPVSATRSVRASVNERLEVPAGRRA